jgi:hypothetical protein
VRNTTTKFDHRASKSLYLRRNLEAQKKLADLADDYHGSKFRLFMEEEETQLKRQQSNNEKSHKMKPMMPMHAPGA